MSQNKVPLWEALVRHKQLQAAQFHIPAHRGGAAIPEDFLQLAGTGLFQIDLTEIPGLDDLHNPQAALAEAQQLAAELFGAEKSFFLVNGTSCGLMAIIMACCTPGDKIIIPRNAHRSVLSGLILSGAIPIYYQPDILGEFACVGGTNPLQIKQVLKENFDAKAVLVVNPTYYGVCGDIATVAKDCHQAGMPLLVDEAHGTHLRFHRELPPDALSCGADAVVQSTHKTGGSLTQSSLLHLQGELIDKKRVADALRMVQSTSPSYILMASLDLARRQLALEGQKLLENTLRLAGWCRAKLKTSPGIRVLNEGTLACHDGNMLDATRLTISLLGLGLTGYQTAELLEQEYGVFVEMADYASVVAIIALGTTKDDCRRLVEALQQITTQTAGVSLTIPESLRLPTPCVKLNPRDAWQSKSQEILLEDSLGYISSETIAVYPPGIPVLCPGEQITPQVFEYLLTIRQGGYKLQGPSDPALKRIKVIPQSTGGAANFYCF